MRNMVEKSATQLDMRENRAILSCPWTDKRLPRVRGLVPSRDPAALLHVMASGPRKAVAGLVDMERPSTSPHQSDPE